MYAFTIIAVKHLYIYDLDLWPLTQKTFSPIPHSQDKYLQEGGGQRVAEWLSLSSKQEVTGLNPGAAKSVGQWWNHL